jgi:hypothetical protein
MSIVSDIKIKMVNHMVCEITQLKRGEISCANKMLTERIEEMDRIFAMECLIATGDSTYNSLIKYIYEQIKEMSTKLILKY